MKRQQLIKCYRRVDLESVGKRFWEWREHILLQFGQSRTKDIHDRKTTRTKEEAGEQHSLFDDSVCERIYEYVERYVDTWKLLLTLSCMLYSSSFYACFILWEFSNLGQTDPLESLIQQIYGALTSNTELSTEYSEHFVMNLVFLQFQQPVSNSFLLSH